MTLKVKFLDQDGFKICDSDALIHACSQVPLPCTPDYSDTLWATPITDSLDIYCNPIISGPPCHIVFSFTYRTVTVGSTVLSRDIQVLSYKADSNCNCESEQIIKMLEAIWSAPNVINNFGLQNFNSQQWPQGDTVCFTNFRVITTDCWEKYLYSKNNKPVYQKKCNKDTCCYEIYEVCYIKSWVGNSIRYEDSSYYKLYSVYAPITCPNPCASLNCPQFINPPNGGGGHDNASHPHLPKDSFGEPDLKDSLCHVFIKSDKKQDEKLIEIECEMNGNFSLDIIDLLGNFILHKDINKNNYQINVPIYLNVNSGIYLLRIIIDSKQIYYNKINIIK